jgi:hypothetical protein
VKRFLEIGPTWRVATMANGSSDTISTDAADGDWIGRELPAPWARASLVHVIGDEAQHALDACVVIIRGCRSHHADM